MSRFLEARGRALIGWDEILEGGTEGLAPNAVVMSWRGVDGGLAAAQAGHPGVLTPPAKTYFAFFPSQKTPNQPPAPRGFPPPHARPSPPPPPPSLPSP